MELPQSVEKLAIAVTFHYAENRLGFLSRISSKFALLAKKVDVVVVTNAADDLRQNNVKNAIQNGRFNLRVSCPTLLGHPYLLAWSHLDVFRRLVQEDRSISHFMYLEDDVLVTPENLEYWLRGRQLLKPFGLIPSFLRYEFKRNDGSPYSTDITKRAKFWKLPRVRITDTYFYVNLRQPYQGMYLLDRELMNEHLSGPSSSPDFGPWSIREKAAQGLTYANVPKGCRSRNFVGFDTAQGTVDSKSLIHHTPNNYAENPDTEFGKIRISEIIRYSKVRAHWAKKGLILRNRVA